jgi:hypothetical protein
VGSSTNRLREYELGSWARPMNLHGQTGRLIVAKIICSHRSTVRVEYQPQAFLTSPRVG